MKKMTVKRKLGLFGRVFRMADNRLVHYFMFGGFDGKVKKGRTAVRKWRDHVKD